MSAPIHMAELLTLLEENAKAARVTGAHASIMAANMDLNAARATEQHVAAMNGLRNLCAALLQNTQPPDTTVNGRLKLTG